MKSDPIGDEVRLAARRGSSHPADGGLFVPAGETPTVTDTTDRLREAFEATEYPVDSVGENRGLVQIHLQTDEANGDQLREIAEDAIGDALLGVDISVEEVGDDLGTVVSVRHR